MNKLCLLGAATMVAIAFLPDVASAQRGGGGMRGGGAVVFTVAGWAAVSAAVQSAAAFGAGR